MTSKRVERRLAAVVAADVVGYSRLMGVDEVGTLAALKAHRREVVDPAIAEHRGRIVKTTGDGILLEFASVVDAVTFAVVVQGKMAERNEVTEPKISFRIGINIGDIIIDGDDIFGDGVNVAARVEGECEPGGVYLSGSAFDQVRRKTGFAFDDLGEKSLKNIDHPVRLYSVHSAGAAVAKLAGKAPVKPLPLPDKPSIAVLAFTNMSGDKEQEYMADGIAEDIITMLSRSVSLFVIARNSSFVYKGRAIDVRRVAHELGVRYVLEGSVRRGGDHLRVTAQLIDAESGNHIWAERYDRNLSDMFALQDEITVAVAGAIEPAVAAVEQQRAVRKAPESLSAWEAYQRGLWHIARITAKDNLAAKGFFQRAIALDPGFAVAHARLALVIGNEAITYQERGLADAVREVHLHSRTALSLDQSDALAHSSMGWYWLLRGDHVRACTEARQALSFSPNLSLAHWILGVALMFSGRPREGIDAVRESMRLDPKDPRKFLGWLNIAVGHYLTRDYKSAVDAANEALHLYPDHPLVSRWLAAALAQAGRLDEAALALQNALAISPKTFEMYVSQRVPWMQPDDYNHMLDGLKKAGWTRRISE